jgi:hypothetical protein
MPEDTFWHYACRSRRAKQKVETLFQGTDIHTEALQKRVNMVFAP